MQRLLKYAALKNASGFNCWFFHINCIYGKLNCQTINDTILS